MLLLLIFRHTLNIVLAPLSHVWIFVMDKKIKILRDVADAPTCKMGYISRRSSETLRVATGESFAKIVIPTMQLKILAFGHDVTFSLAPT